MFLCCTNVSSQAKGKCEPLRTLLQMFLACQTISLSCPPPSRAAARQPQPGQDYKSKTHGEGGDLVLLLWSQLVVNFLWKPLSAVVGEVGPYELLLGEAEDTKTAALQSVVNYVARVRHHFCSLEDPVRRMFSHICYQSLYSPESNETNLGTMDEQPTVSHLRLHI